MKEGRPYYYLGDLTNYNLIELLMVYSKVIVVGNQYSPE